MLRSLNTWFKGLEILPRASNVLAPVLLTWFLMSKPCLAFLHAFNLAAL